MMLRTGDVTREGTAVDCRDLDLDPDSVVAAIREGTGAVAVEATDPNPVHERVGLVEPGAGLWVRASLADAARSRGHEAPQDETIRDLRERLASIDPPEVSTRESRRALAEAGSETDRLRERVAELRGRVRAREESGDDPTDLKAELADAVRELSEAETERIAARERHERAVGAAREARDARERRLQLEDRIGNLERAARAHLVGCVRDEYVDAVAATPGSERVVDPFEAEPVTAALAVARVADLSAPVVLACDRFADPAAAADWLGAPVVRL
jgi:chromosome segregation ATPase